MQVYQSPSTVKYDGHLIHLRYLPSILAIQKGRLPQGRQISGDDLAVSLCQLPGYVRHLHPYPSSRRRRR